MNLPEEMTLAGISKDKEGYVQYRADYSFNTGKSAGKSESADGTPESMIVYQTPYFTRTIGLRVECFFLSYPHESGYMAKLTDREFRAAAQEWAAKALKIPAEDVLVDWAVDPLANTVGTVTYQLETVNWTVYLQMADNGEYLWAGFYRQANQD